MHTELINEVCRGLTESSDVRFGIDDVHEGLNDRAKANRDDTVLRALGDACAYHFARNCQGGGEDESGLSLGPYSPMAIFPEWVYPMPLGSVADEVLDIWREHAADGSLHPLVRARLADLLWVRKHDRRGRWFEVAVDSFVELASIEAVRIWERGAGLIRACIICSESNHRGLLTRPTESLAQLVRNTLATADNQYGVVAGGLLTLVDYDYPCHDLIGDAIEQYGTNPRQRSELLTAAIRSSESEEEQRDLQRERVRAFETAAEQSSGMARMSHLAEARTIATEAGLAEEVRRLSVMIEHTDMSDEWQTIESTVEIDMEAIRAEAEQLVGDDGLLPALLRFGQVEPIGDPDETRQRMADPARQSLLQSLTTRVVIGPENTLSVVPSGHPQRDELAVGADDANAIQWFAALFGKCALDVIQERYRPDATTVAACFAAMGVPANLATRVAVSYHHWTQGDPISAVSVLVLTLEPIIRTVCRPRTNITETRRVGGISTAKVRTLRPLINDLEEHIGPTRTRYLEASLVDRGSLNLRNNLAHGLTDLDESQYVTLFHLACMLGWISSTPRTL